MKFDRNAEKTSATGRTMKTNKVSEQEFWLTKLDRVCRRGRIVQDERFYTLVSEGILIKKFPVNYT